MFPFKDDNPTRTPPILNWVLIGSCVLIHLLAINAVDLQNIFNNYGVIPSGGIEVFDLLSYQFLHANVVHLVGNMVFLWIFGDNIEDCLGRGRYLLLYLLCGIGAGLTHTLVNSNSILPLIGASGSISGVMGAYLIRYPRKKILFIVVVFPLRLPAFILLLFWLGRDIYGLISLSDSSNVAFSAHIGGFVTGIILFTLFGGFRRQGHETIVKRVGARRKSLDI